MQQSINYVLQNYIQAKAQQYNSNQVAVHIRRKIINEIISKATIDLNKYIVEGSAGAGKWADVPWVALFDKDITDTATKGYDIVYLFRKDMSGVYISLNQGWTYFEKKYGRKEGRLRIKQVSNAWKAVLSSTLSDFSFDPISLDPIREKFDLSEGYELGHICGKFYEAGKIPQDEVLVNDLRNLMGVYRELKGRLSDNSVDNTNNRIITEVELGLISVPQSKEVEKNEEDLIDDDLLAFNDLGQLIETPVSSSINYKDSSPDFKPRKTDFLKKSRNQKKLGHAGELLVMNYEKEKLINAGRTDLAEKVRHVSYEDGDGAGYDILSFDEKENNKYIEVKTTTLDEKTPFMITKNELLFSEKNPDEYYLYRVYSFDKQQASGLFYTLHGSLREVLQLDPIQYSACGIQSS